MDVVGGKHGKYVYIERRDGWYVKARVFKGREDADPDKYIIVGPKTRRPPLTYQVIGEDNLPDEVKARLYEV